MKPLIFVPGLFGSMGNDIIPGTGNWNFGLAAINYSPFMERLKAMGYTEGHNLFVCFYDWRRTVKECAETYLMPKIQEVKAKCHKEDVIIIAHSMGGLLARYYVQSPAYKHDIDTLIMIGTPNAGSVIAYYPWEGGTTPPDDSPLGLASHWLLKGYAWLFSKILDSPSPLDTIHATLPSLQDLLPTTQHPPYLFEHDRFNQKQFISIDQMYYRNYFLEDLNRMAYNLFSKDVHIFNITGDTKSTISYIEVNKPAYALASPAKVWPDGQPVKAYTTRQGDGTVLAASAQWIGGQQYVFPAAHSALPVEASHIIAHILHMPETLMPVHGSTLTSYLSIIADGPVSLSIQAYKSNNLSAQALSTGSGQSWLFLPQFTPSRITVNITGLDSGEYTLAIDTPHTAMDHIDEFRSFIKSGEIQAISIQILPLVKRPIIKRIMH